MSATNNTILFPTSKPLSNVLVNLANNLPVQKAYIDMLKSRCDQAVVGATVTADYVIIETLFGVTGNGTTGQIGQGIYNTITNLQTLFNNSTDYQNLVGRVIAQ
jgi:hypothetical protein